MDIIIGTISNCYNTGTVTCNAAIGGIAGGNFNDGTILNCYNIGNLVYNRNLQIGSICGCNGESYRPGGTISNCYYLNKGNNGIGDSYGAKKNETFSKTDEEMKAMSDEISDEFMQDIQNEDKTWKYNNGYPILKWQKIK